MNVDISSSLEEINEGGKKGIILMNKIKQENESLSNENIKLIKQIAKLKNQVDKAVGSSTDAEQVRVRNQQLEQQLLNANSKSAEFENRLNIALKKIDELQNCKDQHSKVQKPAFGLNAELNEKINTLTTQVSGLEDQLAKEKSAKFALQTEIDQIYTFASQCFKSTIQSSASLIENILKLQEIKEKYSDSQVQMNHLLNKCQKLKQQIKKIDETSQNAITSIKLDNERLVKSLERYKSENINLTQNLNDYRNKIAKLEQDNIDSNSKIQQQQEQSINSIRELQNKHQQEIEALKQQLKNEQANNNKLSGEILSLNLKIDSSEKDLKIIQEKMNVLQSKVTKWKGKYREAQEKLQTPPPPPPKPEISPEEFEKVVKKNTDLSNENEHINEILKQKELFESEIQAKLAESYKCIKYLKKEIKSITELNEIPNGVWLHCKVPREISDFVHEVSSNPATKLSIKIPQIINSIYEFYKESNEKWAISAQKARDELENSKKKLNILTSYLSRLFPDVVINFEGIADEEKSREILHTSILKWKEAQKDTNMQLDELRKSVNVHFGVLGVDSFSDASKAVTELIFKAKKLKKDNKLLSNQLSQSLQNEESLERSLKKIQDQKAKTLDTIHVLEQENTQLAQRIHELETLPPDPTMTSQIQKQKQELVQFDKVIGDLNIKLQASLDENAALVHENEQLKSEIQEAIESIKKFKAQGDNMKEDASYKYDELVTKIKQQKKQIKFERTTFESQYQKLQSQSEQIIASLKTRIAELESENEKINNKNVDLQTSLKTAETKFAALLDEKEREKKNLESQLQARLNSMSSDMHHQVENAQMNTDLAMKHVMQTLVHAFPFLYNSGSDLSICEYEGYIAALKEKYD
ncbi:hypothetical protein TVAGG3_0340930, partial [Trichomonas vaginalis G3]|uniref:hypothetical protein n=1 Tax=Trichomonas vaginalis (strain ATCC PRA-98 / G3) TaxID=412133 RepID=UPI0021E57448